MMRNDTGDQLFASHLNPGVIVKPVGAETLAEAIDDETLLDAVDGDVLRERIRSADTAEGTR